MAIPVAMLLIKEHFGETLATVVGYLMRKGRTPLKRIAFDNDLDVSQVKKALAIALHHSLVTFEQHKLGFLEYLASPTPALFIARYPRYIACAKNLYGDIAELLIEELLQQGQAPVSLLLPRVLERINESLLGGQKATVNQVRDKFVCLLQTHFIERCPDLVTSDSGRQSHCQQPAFDIPKLELDSLISKLGASTASDEPPAKKQKTASGFQPQTPVLAATAASWWRVNFSRFHQYMRDQELVSAAENKFGKQLAELLRTILRLSEVRTHPDSIVSDPLSSNEIFQALPKELGMKRTIMDQHLAVLAEDSAAFIVKAGDSGGGTYVINFQKLLSSICSAHVESIIQERFGSKSLRIFRILRLKLHLEQKPIEEYCLIPSKEAKDMMYNMLSENFLSLTELAKTPDHAPSRTLYLFTVSMEKVARSCADHCIKAIYNMMVKRNSLLVEHQRLLDKQQRIDAIVSTLEQSGADDAQKNEVQEMITQAERQQIAQIKAMANRLEQGEIQVGETLFILETFLEYTVKARS